MLRFFNTFLSKSAVVCRNASCRFRKDVGSASQSVWGTRCSDVTDQMPTTPTLLNVPETTFNSCNSFLFELDLLIRPSITATLPFAGLRRRYYLQPFQYNGNLHIWLIYLSLYCTIKRSFLNEAVKESREFFSYVILYCFLE